MKIQSVQLRNFRRFTHLTIQGLPPTARLVVLAGPNGVGKSSFFDGLITWYRRHAWNNGYGTEEYSAKIGASDSSYFFDRVSVQLHSPPGQQSDLKSLAIYFRTAYRHAGEFQVRSLTQQRSPVENGGPARRAVDMDQSVSENYQRLLWQTFSAVYDDDMPESATKAQIRDRLIGKLREALKRVFPDLTLTRVGGLGQGHSFEFTKGSAVGFPYVNLSAGEKAVFDLLLDAVVKAEFYTDAIWLIDEPELHIGTKAQALLLDELLSLVPQSSQLYLASHSLGLMSQAVRLAQRALEEVVFLDFGSSDFDAPVVIEPISPSRDFWKRTLAVALDDLAELVAPSRLVLCEGGGDGFDAKCYRTIFSSRYPDVDFLSVGNSHDAGQDRVGLTSALQTIAQGTVVIRLRDRDLATGAEVAEWLSNGIRTLGRRHIESYLYDPEVLDALCDYVGKADLKQAVKNARQARVLELEAREKDPDDIKAAAGFIYTDVRRLLSLTGAGTTARAFAEEHLAPRICPGMAVYAELEVALFGEARSRGNADVTMR